METYQEILNATKVSRSTALTAINKAKIAINLAVETRQKARLTRQKAVALRSAIKKLDTYITFV